MNVITLDFETYYDTEHSLAHLSAVQYVHSPLFKVWGVGIKINDAQPEKNFSNLTLVDVQNWCSGKLATYKIPKLLEFRNELPKNNIGKILWRQVG